MHKVIITIIIAVIGGVVGHYLKLPAGAMVGAMISVGAANILDVQPQLPETLNILGQIIIGAALGLSVTKEVLVGLKDYLVPSLLVVILLAVFGVVTGFIVTKLTGVDLYTSLFGSVPGGMHEMVILSQSYDVNHPAVMTIQTVRRVLIVVIYPLLVLLVSKLTGSYMHLLDK
ncbi:MAG: AbrB family transcriptional regulator [Tepidanaerobacteraceae bacterium]|jgi:membrane AbrB-like protein|nr:AbrB family transcriptional regulator [Tepidanaerobacter sp.]HQA60669.1 AbrB family transcriptional regulator [Tepidanaerobacteraceae bacterium]HQE04811.1 AbrB family transcriptional regulator [Tepidanaerobacteraceae bacterium]